MAVDGYVKNELENVVLFVSDDAGYSGDKKGVFNLVSNSAEYEHFFATYKVFVAAVGADASTIVNSSHISGGSYTKERDNYIVLTGGTVHYYPKGTTVADRGNVTIIDEHGTHKGTASCQNKMCATSPYRGCIGVQHEYTDRGWMFKGWKMTSNSTSYIDVPSSGYEYKYDFEAESERCVWSLSDDASDEEKKGAFIVYSLYTNPIRIEAIYEQSSDPGGDDPNYPTNPSVTTGKLAHFAASGNLIFNSITGLLAYT